MKISPSNESQKSYKQNDYHISLVIKDEDFPLQIISKILQNHPQKLDPANKVDLNFGYFFVGKALYCNRFFVRLTFNIKGHSREGKLCFIAK